MSDTLLTFIHISDTHLNPDLDYTKSYADYTPIEGARELVKHSIQAFAIHSRFYFAHRRCRL